MEPEGDSWLLSKGDNRPASEVGGVKVLSSDLDPRGPILLSLDNVAFFLALGFLNKTWEHGGYLRAETLKRGKD